LISNPMLPSVSIALSQATRIGSGVLASRDALLRILQRSTTKSSTAATGKVYS
jgi:hypothetical protein